MDEKEVVTVIKKYLEAKTDVSYTDTEYTFIKDGCVADVIGYSNSKIKYIIECKGSINPGGIAGGLGQALQYYYQKKNNENVDLNSEVYFACPKDMEKYLKLMHIPKEIKKILLVSDDRNVIELRTIKSKKGDKVLQIEGTTYLEATTIELITITIKVLFKLKEEQRNKKDFLKIMKLSYPEITDHRNTLITPRGLGLVENYNLSPKGYYFYGLLKRNKKEFKKELIKLLYPSLIVVINAFIVFINKTNQQINKFIYVQKDIEQEIINIYKSEVNYFDYRRLSYAIKILKEIGVLKEYKLNNKKYASIEKITNLE